MSLENKIIQWLDNQGYPLEMQIARILKREGFTVSMGDIYADIETGIQREIDVTATKWIVGDQWIVQICFRIECKLSRDKPWVIFTSREVPEYFIGSLIGSKPYREFLFNVYSTNAAWKQKVLERQPFNNVHVGHGITRAFSEGEDVPYKAVMSSVKSAIAKEAEFSNIAKRRFENYQYVIAIPVVVFDGILFEANLDEEGELDRTDVAQSVINWKRVPIHNTLVSVVTLDGFNDFAGEMTKLVNIFEAITHSNSTDFEKLIENYEAIGF